MPPFSDWFPFAMTGLVFTALGLVKLYGLCRGITSGRGRPALERMCGTCARPVNRTAALAMPFLFLAIGIGELTLCARLFWVGQPPVGSESPAQHGPLVNGRESQ